VTVSYPVSTILLDLERFISESTATAKSVGIGIERKRAVLSTLDQLRSVLSALLTPMVNEEIDEICCSRLGISPSPVSVGLSRSSAFNILPKYSLTTSHDSSGSISLYCSNSGRDAWCISPEISAARALSIIAVLRVLGLFEGLSISSNYEAYPYPHKQSYRKTPTRS
jgi:WD repeat-containing protein 7